MLPMTTLLMGFLPGIAWLQINLEKLVMPRCRYAAKASECPGSRHGTPWMKATSPGCETSWQTPAGDEVSHPGCNGFSSKIFQDGFSISQTNRGISISKKHGSTKEVRKPPWKSGRCSTTGWTLDKENEEINKPTNLLLPRKLNMEPENDSSQKGVHLFFQGFIFW